MRVTATVAETLALAWPQGYLRVFADEVTPKWPALWQPIASRRDRQAPRLAAPEPCLGRCGRRFGTALLRLRQRRQDRPLE
jgi:hypothetical protein